MAIKIFVVKLVQKVASCQHWQRRYDRRSVLGSQSRHHRCHRWWLWEKEDTRENYWSSGFCGCFSVSPTDGLNFGGLGGWYQAGHSPNTLGRWSYWWSNHAIVWTVSHPTSTHFYDEIMNFLHVLFYIDSFLSNFRLQVLRKHEWLMGLSSLYLLRFSLRVEEVSNLLLLWKLLCINNILYAS